MDDDEIVDLLIRAWALHCSATSFQSGDPGARKVTERAAKFEEYLRGEQGH